HHCIRPSCIISPIPIPRPRSTLFPYTTLFRSLRSVGARPRPRPGAMSGGLACALWRSPSPSKCPIQRFRTPTNVGYHHHHGARRSEEHTSELQSRFDLVCSLLLETTNNKAGRT